MVHFHRGKKKKEERLYRKNDIKSKCHVPVFIDEKLYKQGNKTWKTSKQISILLCLLKHLCFIIFIVLQRTFLELAVIVVGCLTANVISIHRKVYELCISAFPTCAFQLTFPYNTSSSIKHKEWVSHLLTLYPHRKWSQRQRNSLDQIQWAATSTAGSYWLLFPSLSSQLC